MMPVRLSRGVRHALLIATGRHLYPDFTDLGAPPGDVRGLAKVLGDKELGGFDVELLIDQPHVDIKKKIESLVRDKNQDDLILVYFSCHGIRDNRDGRLHFVAHDSEQLHVHSTMIAAQFVNRMFSDSAAGMRVLILDSCFSGAFVQESAWRDDGSLVSEVTGNGYVVITATDSFEYARDGVLDVCGGPQMSPFTRSIVEGIATGSAARHDRTVITVNDLREHVQAARLPGQTPQFFASQAHGEIPISRVPARVTGPAGPANPPTEGRPSWGKRLREQDTDHPAVALALFLGMAGFASGQTSGWTPGASLVLASAVFAVVYAVYLMLSVSFGPHPPDDSGEL